MRQSKFHRDILHRTLNGEYEHITMNDDDLLIGFHLDESHWVNNSIEHLEIDEKLKLVADLIERKAHELEGYTELYSGLIIQRNLPGAKVVRKNKGSTNDT